MDRPRLRAMAKRRFQHKLRSWGIYDRFERGQIPRIREFTDTIPAAVGTEFGYVLHITGGKGSMLDFRIEHPPFRDSDGKVMKPFVGQQPITSNEFDFFLGDVIWEPWHDKVGPWILHTWHDGQLLERKALLMVAPEDDGI